MNAQTASHTQSNAVAERYDSYEYHITLKDKRLNNGKDFRWTKAIIVYGIEDAEELGAEIAKANADFVAEAFNVYHETGLTPRQLADQRAELLEALRGLERLYGIASELPTEHPAWVRARAAIQRATGEQP